MSSLYYKISIAFLAATLMTCGTKVEYSPLLRAEPEIGGVLEQAPRTLRLYFKALPEVPLSSLRLLGPGGEHKLRGLHTMAADDLMIEILDPVTPGQYTVYWTTVVGDDPAVYSGSYDFVLQN